MKPLKNVIYSIYETMNRSDLRSYLLAENDKVPNSRFTNLYLNLEFTIGKTNVVSMILQMLEYILTTERSEI